MALHELMTNAIKYGALKQSNGHLTVRWRQETLTESGKPWLHLDWKESGVDMPLMCAKSQGRGQGRELIERVLPYQFDAQTTFVIGNGWRPLHHFASRLRTQGDRSS
jgi:two-component system CheB/CheR fusion protein